MFFNFFINEYKVTNVNKHFIQKSFFKLRVGSSNSLLLWRFNVSKRTAAMRHTDQSINSEAETVGFDVRNKHRIAQIYICPVCSLLLRDPIRLDCGHRICRSCINAKHRSFIQCSKCNIETSYDEIKVDSNCQQEMASLSVLCSFCDWNGLFENYQEHLSTHQTSAFCKYCRKYFGSMTSCIEHRLKCGNMTVNCQLKQYGCTEQFLRKNTESHLLTGKHRSVMVNALLETMSDVTKSSHMNWDSNDATTSTSSTPNDQLQEHINTLVDSTEVLMDENQRLSSETTCSHSSLKTVEEDLSHLKTVIENTNACAHAFKVNQQVLQQDITSLQRDAEDLQNTSHDGTFLWKIENITQKMADAQSEKQTSIYSPPFYSSPNGYKMRARFYLNGDGNARQTHASLFFVLMRGEYDAILQFPFNYKVICFLYDQTSQQRHITGSFRPDTNSSSFQRPSTDMNPASGLPRFAPLPVIQQENSPYMRNNTMFIKIMVCFEDIPKTHLPYLIHINPGLPASIQKVMLQQQMEKQAQQQQQTTTDLSIIPSTLINVE